MHAGSNLALSVSEFNPIFNMQNSKYNAVQVNNENDSVFNRLKEDIDRLETKANKHSQIEQTTLNALSPLPTIRRIQSLPDSLEENNYPRAGLLLGLAAANFPGDLREIGLALKNPFEKRPYQHEMSFFKLTLLDKLPKKYPWLGKMDKTFFSSGAGKFLRNKLNIGIDLFDIGNIEDTCTKTNLKAYKYTGNFLQRTLGRAMHRIPVIGLFASTALEIPGLIKSLTKTEGSVTEKSKAFGKQLVKSAGYVGFTTAAISIAGAITFPYSALLSLVGMAIGSTIGLMASKHLNKLVDNI
ncbi:MAG: hypothetical protein A2Y25_10470 [Candidatus Melainabacteria bacterium GWF2_37_15]|nr:MAG: hypothetical protein A2Y25_10470 [Candidatus Melainabacteria bacterium GWF2_37_15]